jgi:protein-tyrosine kinase
MRRIENSNLFLLPAGEAVINPLELLHLKGVERLMDRLRNAFRSIFLDSPALLIASDANLLSTLADGTLLVTRIGATTVASLSRAIESLGQENILGIVANATTPTADH